MSTPNRPVRSGSAPAEHVVTESRSAERRSLILGDLDRLWFRVAVCGLVLLPGVLLWPYRGAGFVSDDFFFGPAFSMASWRDVFLGPWPHGIGSGSAKAWRPIVLLTYLAQAVPIGGDPDGHRVFNYVVHGVNAALFAVLARKIIARRDAGLVAGVLFAVHPIVNESVLWISGRTFPIAALFGLTLCVWTAGASRRRPWLQHAVGAALMAAALASYEFAVVLPLVVAGVMCRTWSGSGLTWRRVGSFVTPYALTLAVYLVFRWAWLSDLSSDVSVALRTSHEWPTARGTYLLARTALFFVVRLLAWPWLDRGSDLAFGLTGMITTAVAVAALVIAWRNEQTRATGWFWLGWIGLFFAPVAAHGFSDRFGYLSAAGLAGLIATGMAALNMSARVPRRARVATHLVVSTVAIMWAADLRAHGRDWLSAGQLAARIVQQVVSLEPSHQQPTVLYVIDIPRRHGSALVFLTSFPRAVASAYPDPAMAARNLTIHVSWDDASEVLELVRAEPPRATARLYRWNPATERLELLWSRES